MSTEAAKQTMLEMIGEGDQHDANDQVAYANVYAILAQADRDDKMLNAQIKGGCFNAPRCRHHDDFPPDEVIG